MPAALTFEEPSTFVITVSGVVTYDEAVWLFDELLAHPRLGPGADILTDARHVSGAPSTAELREIAAYIRPLQDRGLNAVAIVSGSAFVYGVARMFAVFAEMLDARVCAFRSMDDARVWLALTPSEATAE